MQWALQSALVDCESCRHYKSNHACSHYQSCLYQFLPDRGWGSYVAVDVGTSSAAKQIYHCLSARSMEAPSLPMVTATHFHINHVAGISRIVKLFPETRVCFSLAWLRITPKEKTGYASFLPANGSRDCLWPKTITSLIQLPPWWATRLPCPCPSRSPCLPVRWWCRDKPA